MNETGKHEVLRHPLLVTFFAFLMTVLAGAALLHRYDQGAAQRERRTVEQQQRDALAFRTMETFSEIVFARLTSAAMLQSALQRNADKDELVQHRRAHDAAFADSNKRLPHVLLSTQRLLPPDAHLEFDSLVKTQLRRPLQLLSYCIIDGYDARVGIKPKKHLDCDIDTLLTVSRDCSESMTAALVNEFALGLPATPNQPAQIALAAAEVRKRCDVSTTRVT